MAIKQDLSDLPRAEREDTGGGLAPDASPRFVGVLPDAWAMDNASREAEHTPSGAFFRHSDAGKCARAISYRAVGIEQEPMDLTGVWNIRLGTEVHDRWQAAMAARYGDDVAVEQRVSIPEIDSIGFIDAVVTAPDYDEPSDFVSAIELKTIGGFGFKGAVGKASKNRPAEGPRGEHMLQAALNGYAIGADEAVVAYLAKECISQNVGRGMSDLARFAAEWTLSREQYEPLAKGEIMRVAGIKSVVEEGKLAARKIPDLGRNCEIVDPSTGRWEEHQDGKVTDTGTYWGCAYCGYQSLCVQTDSGRIPAEVAIELSTKAAA